ncbi:MAG: DUF1501 domain-containing protein [Pirellulales bacterium]
MTDQHRACWNPLDRRTFLVASTVGFAGLNFGAQVGAAPTGDIRPRTRPAKSTILFFLCGGASHIDTWDMKPDASQEFRGPFQPIATRGEEIRLCEHLPLTAQQSHHLAVVNGVTDYGLATGDHHAGYYYNLTGHVPDPTFRTQGNDRRPYRDDWPFIGSVIASRRPQHSSLPQLITLPHKPSRPPYTRPGQFSARLGSQHDPFYLKADPAKPLEFHAPTLALQTGLTKRRIDRRRSLLKSLEQTRRQFDTDLAIRDFSIQQQRAFGLLASSSATDAFDLNKEPKSVRQRYGGTINGTSLLMARRLVQAGVPFVTVFWKGDTRLNDKCKSAGSWDTHGNNFNCLKNNLLPEFDRGFSALLEDLARTGLLDETLVMVTSEMGRKPKIGDPRSGGKSGAGRDHWTACMSVLLAGGGIRGGQIYGETDPRAEYPTSNPIGPEDIAKTVYYAMGVSDLTANDAQGRPFNLLEDGRSLVELF